MTGAKRLGEVEIDGLCKNFGSLRVIDDLSLHVEPGQFVSLIGPSGSGKTTTLMAIAGFLSPDSGSIRLDGRDIVNLTPQQRDLGVVFQNYAIFPHKTVFENVAFPLRVRKVGREEIQRRVKEALDVVKLGPYADRYSRQLSGGQQQRVALARAIVFNPRIILMDEPLGALDKNLRYHMQVELKELQRRLDTTVIYVTHDQEEAMNMSDRIAVMNNGALEQFGPPDHLYNAPATAFVAEFLGEANMLEACFSENSDGTVLARINGSHDLHVHRSAGSDLSNARLFIRPEKIEILPPKTGNLPAVVTRVSFLGNITRYTVTTGSQDVVVDAQNSVGENIHPVGTSVGLHIDPHSAMVIAK